MLNLDILTTATSTGTDIMVMLFLTFISVSIVLSIGGFLIKIFTKGGGE